MFVSYSQTRSIGELILNHADFDDIKHRRMFSHLANLMISVAFLGFSLIYIGESDT